MEMEIHWDLMSKVNSALKIQVRIYVKKEMNFDSGKNILFVSKNIFNLNKVTPGYLNNDEENAKLFTSDGFLKTGDYGYYDENEFFYVIGRYKEIINVEGNFVVVSSFIIFNLQLTNNCFFNYSD